MTDIILFQPKCGMWDMMGVRAPTGLLNIASVPVSKGYNVVLVDQRINPNWKHDLQRHMKTAQIVCLTTMVGEQIDYMMEVSAVIKSINPRILTVLGGSWAQTQPEMCMQDRNVDIVCYGEGDFLLPDLMEYCKGKRKIDKVLGIVYRKEEKLVRTEARPLIKNLDSLPKIPYHLVNLKDYTAVGFRRGMPSISLVLSRGCPYRCAFCSIVSMYKRSWRSYSVKRILEDLEELEKRYGIKDFYFNDDHIAGNPKHFSDFVKALAKSGKDYNWGTAGIRADSIMLLDDETLDNLVKSGCKNLDIGVESGNKRVLELIRKDTSLELIRKANKRLSKYPIIIKYTFMGGFPTETEQEFLDTLKFRRILQNENSNAVAPIFFYTPFPGTELFGLALKTGLRFPKTLKGWSSFNYNTWYKVYPSWLSKKKIELVENAVFLSYFADKKLGYKYPNPLMNLMFRIYYPVASFRYNHNFYGFMIEKKLADLIAKLNEKFNLFNRFKKS